MNPRLGSLIALLGMGAAWGLQISMLKLAVQSGHSEINILIIALVLISIVYGSLLCIRRQFFKLTQARFRFFLVIAVIGYLVPMAATLYAARQVSAGILALLVSLSPLFTFAAALVSGTEPVSRIRIWAMLFGIMATLLVLVPGLGPGKPVAGAGLVLALLVPFCYGIESIYVDAKWPRGLSVLQVGTGEAVMAAILAMPLLVMFGDTASISLGWNQTTLAVTVFVLCGVLEVFLYFYLIRATGGVLVSFATFVSLFAGIGWGMLIFDETHTRFTWIAVLAVSISLTLVSVDTARQPGRPAP